MAANWPGRSEGLSQICVTLAEIAHPALVIHCAQPARCHSVKN